MDQFDLFATPAPVLTPYVPRSAVVFPDDDWADRGHPGYFFIVCELCRVPGYQRRRVLGWSSSFPTRRAYSFAAGV